MIDAPCKGCEERHVGCHSKCERYLKEKEKRNAVSEALKKEVEITNYFVQKTRRKK